MRPSTSALRDPEIEEQLQRELVQNVFASNTSGIVLTLLLAPLTALRLAPHRPGGSLYWYWAAYMVVTALGRLALGLGFERARDGGRATGGWTWGLVALMLAIGAGWGALAHPAFVGDESIAFLTCALLFAICAIAMFGFASYLPVFYAVLIPVVVCQIAAAAVAPFPLSTEWLLMSTLFGAIMALGGRRLSGVIHRETRSRLMSYRLHEAAAAASAAKSQFLANMSHEIRTPLTGVLGLTELMLANPLAHELSDRLQRIRASGQSLLAIVNDALDLASLEKGKVSLHHELFDIQQCAHDVLGLFEAELRQRGLATAIYTPADFSPILYSDPARCRQVLTNLVANAIKFTHSGHVHIKLVGGGHTPTRIEVTDTGIGIAPDDVERLFLPFVQGDESNTRVYGGTGLGLAIVKRLVGCLGGELGVRSEPGRGSTFWFTLPALTPPQHHEAPVPSAKASPGKGQVAMRVLVVDDNANNRAVLEGMLLALGHLPIVATDGVDALQQLTEREFDVVLLDLHMPRLDGLETARSIRKRFEDRRCPRVIAVTGAAVSGTAEQCREAGMQGVLYKPYRLSQLEAILVGGD